jgi:beta-glucosidase
MTSYNAWNHMPMGANPVLRDVVMKDWGFDGIICTDVGALGNMVRAHHTYATMPEAAAAAIHAGINQFLKNATKPVQDALTQGLIKESDIDQNLRGVFRAMIRLGMFDPRASQPYAHLGFDAPSGNVDDPWLWAKNKALARKVTDESIVLLKNDGNLLPLQTKTLKHIAVMGPLADKVALDWGSGLQ